MENINIHTGKVSLKGFRGGSFLLLLLLISLPVFSQKQVRKDIRTGNKEYRKEKFTDAEIAYRKALENNARSPEAAYNLGNALYRQEKGQEALEQYRATIDRETNPEKRAKAWHNTGNVFMAAKDYTKSIEAYKQALRSNPHDDETRYNLALAQKLLQDQENQDQNQDQQKQEQQQKQEEQKKEQEQQQQKQQEQEQKQQEQQQQQPNEMSKQNADQILEALMQDEKNTQEKVKEMQIRQQQRNKKDKNW